MTTNPSPDRLTPEQFNKAIEGRRFTTRGAAIARRLLVDGAKVPDVIREFKISRARAHRIRRDVFEAHMQATQYPKDWVSATLIGPADEIRKFKARTQGLLRKWRSYQSAVANEEDE